MFPKSVLLFVVFFISISAYAQQQPVEEVVVTGQQTNNSMGNPYYNNAGIAANAIRHGTTWSNAAHAAAAAAQAANKKQEEAAKKKWCKDNNFPASVAFCADHKKEEERKIERCLEGVKITRTLCNVDARTDYTDDTLACTNFFLNKNLLDQCNKAAVARREAHLETCGSNEEIAQFNCKYQ